MKSTIITEVCKGEDLEVGDIFYTWKYGEKKQWKVTSPTGEKETDYGIAVTSGDNLYFNKSNVFIVKDIK